MDNKRIPPHAIPIEAHICADSRKEDCKLYDIVIVDTPYVSFHMGMCGYIYRTDNELNCPPEFSQKEVEDV